MYVWFLFFKNIFENIKKIILVLSKNCFCHLNLVFFMYFRTKKKKLVTKHVFSFFLVLFVF